MGHRVEVGLVEGLDGLMARIAGRFVRAGTRRRARLFLLGLLADLPRKNCWTVAEHAGDRDPSRMQHFLAAASWDEDGVREDLRDYVVGALADTDAVLVVDETGDVKKGSHTVGVQRQYTGTAGRIENAQVAVYLVYATSRGHAFLDRELYLPESWTTDPQRLAEAGVPEEIGFATKPALAAGMLTRAVQAGVPARWVAGDEVYGADPGLRAECEYHRLGYVLAIAENRQVLTTAGTMRVDALAAGLPRHAWQRLSAGNGAKGERIYQWAWVALPDPAARQDRNDHLDTRCWWLLVRRHPTTGELAFYRCFNPEPVPLRTLVRVAGTRWRIEEAFQAGKGLAGLDEHQVRTWTSWRRWTVLAMLAHALLAVLAVQHHDRNPEPDGLIPVTCNEIRRLLILALTQARAVIRACPRAWSNWRRQHQHRAQTSHYRRRADHNR